MDVNEKTATAGSPQWHRVAVPRCQNIMLPVMTSLLQYPGHILILLTWVNIKSHSMGYRTIRLDRFFKILWKHGNRSRSVLLICCFLSHFICHCIFKFQRGMIHSLLSKFFPLLMSIALISSFIHSFKYIKGAWKISWLCSPLPKTTCSPSKSHVMKARQFLVI